ncbi:Pellino protein, partial [Globisporangium splendens]
MEYGRLVVLGYSSYRVATVHHPRSEHMHSQSAAAALEVTNVGAPDSVISNGRVPPGSITRNGTNAAAHATPSSSNGSHHHGLSSNGSHHHSSHSSSKKSLSQLWEPIGDQNAQYILQKRKRANGVALNHFHYFCQRKGASSVSLAKVTKDLKTVTKRMMQAVETKRTADALTDLQTSTDNNNNSSDSNGVDASARSSTSDDAVQDDDAAARARSGPYLMCVPMNDKDAHATVTEYTLDTTMDMFQIGRMPCRQNDFVIPGPRVGASGTISRFAARILCSREPPYQCRIYAGGFDGTKKMTTAGHALKFCTGCSSWLKKLPLDHNCVLAHLAAGSGRSVSRQNTGERESNQTSHLSIRDVLTTTLEDMDHAEMPLHDPSEVPIDGVTKNGVRVWLPEHKQWFEVSVNGNLYAIESRTATSAASSTPSSHSSVASSVRHSSFNRPIAGSDGVPPILTDGAIIDLGGVQLQFQSSHKPQLTNESRGSLIDASEIYGRHTDTSVVDQLERLNIQCPVQLHTLRFTRPEPGEQVDSIQVPHVFPACGHVFGYDPRIASSQTCPLCRHPGNLVKLLLKENSQLQSAADRNAIPECVLNPCGHAISSKLASHYSSLLMPNGRAICPFCAVHLDPMIPFSRLYLYSEMDG